MIHFKNRYIIAGWFCLVSYFGGTESVFAQTTSPEKKWNFLGEVYLLFPNINGETGIGTSIVVPIDANTGDIFDKLTLGGMLYMEAHTKKWAISSDFVFMNLEKEITPSEVMKSGTVSADQYIWELAGLYRINSFLEVGAGGRLNYLSTGIDAVRYLFPIGNEVVTGHQSKTFYDPILIARLSTDIRNKWLFQLRSDLGGFGVGSDFTWQLQGYVGYRFSKLFQVTAGYRVLGIDYDKGSDTERFIFDVNEFGPVIRLGFNF